MLSNKMPNVKILKGKKKTKKEIIKKTCEVWNLSMVSRCLLKPQLFSPLLFVFSICIADV